MKLRITLFLLAFALFACGGGQDQDVKDAGSSAATNTETTSTEEPEAEAPEATSATTEADSTFIELESNDQMRYNQDKLTVKAGNYVVLTLKHVGKLDGKVMGHNFVLLKEGTDVATFATEAIKAIDTGYLPESDAIIANTKMIGGGESDTIRFPAPEKGTYKFICTFPGHYTMMQGEFIVY